MLPSESTKVEKILPDQNQIVLSDGQTLKYDNLFLGLGTSAFIPPIQGTEKIKDIFTFHTLNDARKILNFIKENKVKDATIIGAGLSGVELSDALTSINIKVNLIEKGDRVLSGQVDAKGSELTENELIKNQVKVYKNEAVQKIEEHLSGDKKTFNIEFASGKKLKTEMVVFAIGVKPNTAIANAAGIKLQNGRILTNETMQTNVPNIYAGGDVCLVKDIISGKFVPSCTWPDATMQGMIAGANMSGAEQKFTGVLITVSSRIFDLPFVTCGAVLNPPANSKITVQEDVGSYHKFVTLDKKLIGFLMVGNLQDVGKLKNCAFKKEVFNI